MLLAVALLAVSCTGPAAAADTAGEERTTALDLVANPRLLDTLFARYGYAPLKTIRAHGQGVRIRLPDGVKDVGQTGLYSYVALAGDFEVGASYYWFDFPVPRAGYGMSCGIAVDTLGPDGMLSLARNFSKEKGGSGYAVTRGLPVKGGETKYETNIYPTTAKKGRLVVRREKKELVCLAADGTGDLQELCRVPFTGGTVRQVRFYGDPGGSPTALDAWLGEVRLHAEEITGGFPRRERKGGWGWWPLVLAVGVGVAAAGWLVTRRKPAPEKPVKAAGRPRR